MTNRHIQFNNCIEIESKRNAKSEFYLLQGRKHRLGKRYELSKYKKQLEILKNNANCVIGVHTNFYSYLDEKQLASEIKIINDFLKDKIKSVRNHYLRFKVPDSWQVLQNCGILCDSTLGYSDKNGFRAGTSHSFIPFDLINKNIIDICEVPLIIMDGIEMESDISFDEKWKHMKCMIDMVMKHNGTASILWHDRLICNKDYRVMYEKILDYIVGTGGKFVLSSEIVEKTRKQKENIEHLFSLIEKE